MQLLQEGQNALLQTFTHYAHLVEEHFPEEQHFADVIQTAGLRLIATSNELLQLVEAEALWEDILQKRALFEQNESDFLKAIGKALANEKKELQEMKEHMAKAVYQAFFIIILAVGMASIIAIASGLSLSLSISRALTQLRRGAEKIGKGDFSVNIPDQRQDEIGALSKSFNMMAIDLQESRAKIAMAGDQLDNIISSMGEALLVVSDTGEITKVNPAAERLTEYTQEELIGRNFSELWKNSREVTTRLSQLADNKEPFTYEANLLTPSKKEVVAAMNVSKLDGKTQHPAPAETVCLIRDITERKKAEQRIYQLAYYDVLTGLPNSTHFMVMLEKTIARSPNSEKNIAIVFLDLDQFKDVNTSLGHDTGDNLLIAVAARLQEMLQNDAALSKVGRDIYAFLLTDVADQREIMLTCQQIITAISKPFLINGKEIYTSASLGITVYPNDSKSVSVLMQNAETARHAAKEARRRSYKFFDDSMSQRAVHRRDTEASLIQALEKDELFLEFQPQIDIHTKKIVGVESLLRWHHPSLGPLSPDSFIDVAEESGIISSLTKWVLRSACLQYKKWRNAGIRDLRVAVNISGQQFSQPDFIDAVKEILAKTGMEPSSLEFEFTENTLMKEEKKTIATLIELKVLGIQLAIDDFGTGYSSLNYLKHFPVDRLKIDRSFIRNVATDAKNGALVRAIIAMAHSFGLKVTAEGIETEAELAFLETEGCDEVQGFYFSKAVEPEHLFLNSP
jgi:diguanylate cyclase (GGDEF)-like protein/PAS domain S-box-containing protein